MPSIVVIASATPATSAAISIVPNWRYPTIARPAVTISGPKYGHDVQYSGEHAPDERFGYSQPPQVSQVATATAADVRACTQMKRSICFAMSLRMCTVMRLLLRLSICATSFRLKESSSYRQKDRQEQHGHALSDDAERAQPSRPEHVRHAPRLLDLDARDAGILHCRRSRFGGRRVHRRAAA